MSEALAPFVDVDWLRARLSDGQPPVLADVRWYLDGRSGRAAYEAGHLPGAVFVDLDHDLAGPATSSSGRHPLPSAEAFAAALGRLGIGWDATVIGYDDAGGVIAARFVWMLRTLGVPAAVLDGGIAAWASDLSTQEARRPAVELAPRPWPTEFLADIDDASDRSNLVLDARPADRFAGVGADVDPRSGHIPGAVNVACRDNLGPDGRLLPVEQLRAVFAGAGVRADDVNSGAVISSCGSGVTACHNLLTLELAGFGQARLYPGSWSQYAATDRPLETG